MSAFSDAMRRFVTARAGHRCEYCHLPTRGQVATFPIDHILPRNRGGTTDAANLALTCPHCNGHKWAQVEAADPETNATVRLFHPRSDVWAEHFEYRREQPGILVGRTPVGRATIVALELNDPSMVAIRVLLDELGLFQEAAG